MALPNPSMAFTPFDILLAEELNDLVENIESLADGTGFDAGAIGTTDLADGAVTSAKVDFTTFIYSSTETLVGYSGTKNVYRKVLIGTVNVTASSINIAHGITGLQYMLSVNAAVSLGADTSFQVLPHVEATQRIALSYDNTNIIFGSSFAWGTARPYRIIIYYTKT